MIDPKYYTNEDMEDESAELETDDDSASDDY